MRSSPTPSFSPNRTPTVCLDPMLAQWLILASHQTVITGESAMLLSPQLGTCHRAAIARLLGWGLKQRGEGHTGVGGAGSLPDSSALIPFNPASPRDLRCM